MPLQELEDLAPSLDHRQTGNGGVLAWQGLPALLDLDLETEAQRSPETCPEVRALIRRMAAANPFWGASRTHEELLKLGIQISERSVSRLISKNRKPHSQSWKTFLENHAHQLVSIDFFAVPTATLRVSLVLVVLAPRRRSVPHFNVTEHPTTARAAQQIREAFPHDCAPRYLIRDRDRAYGARFPERVREMGMIEVLTAPQSPRQKAFAEKLIGSFGGSAWTRHRPGKWPVSIPSFFDQLGLGVRL